MRVSLYDASGEPMVTEYEPAEKLAALLCECFGTIAFMDNARAPADVARPEVVLQAIVRAVGPKMLEVRWPGLKVTPREAQ